MDLAAPIHPLNSIHGGRFGASAALLRAMELVWTRISQAPCLTVDPEDAVPNLGPKRTAILSWTALHPTANASRLPGIVGVWRGQMRSLGLRPPLLVAVTSAIPEITFSGTFSGTLVG